jgi:hypothetical protein
VAGDGHTPYFENTPQEPKPIAKNVLRLAISFLNSSLTLRRAWLNFRFGFNHFIGKG